MESQGTMTLRKEVKEWAEENQLSSKVNNMQV